MTSPHIYCKPTAFTFCYFGYALAKSSDLLYNIRKKAGDYGNNSRLYRVRVRANARRLCRALQKDVRRVYGLSERQARSACLRQYRLRQKNQGAVRAYE